MRSRQLGLWRSDGEKVALGIGTESQRAREGVEGACGGMTFAALFQARVVVDADTSELGHLFPPQSRHPAAAPGRKADRIGRDLRPTGLQELTKLVPPRRHCLRLRFGRNWLARPAVSRTGE